MGICTNHTRTNAASTERQGAEGSEIRRDRVNDKNGRPPRNMKHNGNEVQKYFRWLCWEVYACACIYAYVHIYMYTYIRIYECMYVYTHEYTYVYIHKYTYTCV